MVSVRDIVIKSILASQEFLVRAAKEQVKL